MKKLKLKIIDAIIAKLRKGWTQCASAKNASGECVPPESEGAVCWCAIGAAAAVAHDTGLVVDVWGWFENRGRTINLNDWHWKSADDAVSYFEERRRLVERGIV